MDFWLTIASGLGNSRLKLNRKASSIHRFIDQNSDHKDYLRQAIQQSYKLSRCSHLRDPIDLNCVLDILGEIAFELEGARADDLLDIELLEEIAWLIGERFQQSLELDVTHDDQATTGSKVISLDKVRIKRANSNL